MADWPELVEKHADDLAKRLNTPPPPNGYGEIRTVVNSYMLALYDAARAEGAEAQLAAVTEECEAFAALMEMPDGPDGELAGKAKPADLKAYIAELQSEWDGAERRAMQAEARAKRAEQERGELRYALACEGVATGNLRAIAWHLEKNTGKVTIAAIAKQLRAVADRMDEARAALQGDAEAGDGGA